MIALLCLLAAPARALTLEEAWTAAGAGEEAALLHEQRVQTDLLRLQAWGALSPKITLTGNWTLNQRETSMDFSKMFPQEMLDLIENFTGNPVSFGDPLVINQKQYVDWNLTVVQPIFSGKAVPGLFGALALSRAADAQERQGLANLRLSVARAYWGALLAQEAASLSAASLDLARAHLGIAQSLVTNGAAAPQVALQAEMAVARAERDLAAAQARQAQARRALASLTNTPPDGDLSPPPPPAPPCTEADCAVDRALQQRPEALAAQEQARAMQLQATASRMSWLPDVNARFTEAYTENTGFSGENYTWMLVATASWPLWDGGYRLAENLRTASQSRQADANLTRTAEDLRTSTLAALDELRRARLALAAAQREVALGEENLRLSAASFAEGAGTWLDTENARLALDAAKLSLLTEQMNVDLASRAVMLATGDL